MLIFSIIFFLLVILFVSEAIAYELVQQKGYTKTKAIFVALIPVYGIIHAFLLPPLKKVLKSTLRKSYKPKELLLKFVIYFELLLMVVIVLIPIIYIIGASLTDISDIPLTIWPDEISFKNFQNLFNKTKFTNWYWNTLQIAIVNMVVGVIFITGAAYVFARFKFKGKRAGLVTILVLQVFPSFMGLIAMYVLFDAFGLLGKPLALSILYIGGAVPYNLWIIKGYLQNIPKELDESAMIDGANKLQIFFHIILPLSVPILSFVAVSQFMAPWMDYMLPRLLLMVGADSNAQWTVAVGLFDLIDDAAPQFTTFAVGSLIIALPITILYLVFQKYLVEGITAGSTKG